MDRTLRLRRLALFVAGLTLSAGGSLLAGCATPPPPPPPPPPAPAAAPAPAPEAPASAAAPAPEPAPAPGSAQRLALSAIDLLEQGNEEQAVVDIQRALQAEPNHRLAQLLLKQVQTDPVTLLGREHFMYRVEPGESLSRIAGRFLRDVHLFYALARYNDIKVPRQLHGGQLIKVPGRAPARDAAPAAAPPAATSPASPAPAPAAPKAAADAARPELLVAQDYRRGLALMAQQKPAEAIQAFDKVLEREPDHANAKLKRAQALTQVTALIKLLDNTLRRLDAQIAQNPGDAAAKAERAKAAADRARLANVR